MGVLKKIARERTLLSKTRKSWLISYWNIIKSEGWKILPSQVIESTRGIGESHKQLVENL